MIAPEHQTTDDLWDVRAQEKKTREYYQGRIDQLERLINLGKRILQLRGQPGYQDFVDAIEKLREAEQTQLVGCFSSNEHMRIIQGKAQALNDVLNQLRRPEKTVERLEATLKLVKIEFDAKVKTDGKVITDPFGAKP